jgi:hypothetical protein
VEKLSDGLATLDEKCCSMVNTFQEFATGLPQALCKWTEGIEFILHLLPESIG